MERAAVEREYPDTTWGMLHRLDPKAPGWALGIEALCRRYWAPIRHYARAAWAASDEDADDLAQEFFLWLMRGGALQKYSVARGSFRDFLKGLLRNFSRNQRRTNRRLKRGGGSERLSLDATAPIADPRADAEAEFDREFVRTLTDNAMTQVKGRLLGTPRAVLWTIFEEFELKPVDERPSYTDLAARHGVSKGDVGNYLHRVRTLIKEAIRVELANTVTNPAELEAEWSHVFG